MDMSINYPTLAHFRHFRHLRHFSSLFTNDYQISTNSYVRIYKLFMQNKPNFPHFSPKNDDFTKNKPNSNPIQTQFNPIQSQLKPKQTQFKANQTQFSSPVQTQRQAFLANQISMVDLPLGRSKQTVTSRPSAYQAWLCNCSNFFTRRNLTGLLLAISLGRVGKLLFIRTVNRVVSNGALKVIRPPCFSIFVSSLAAQYRAISLCFIQSRLSYRAWILLNTSLKILKPISSPLKYRPGQWQTIIVGSPLSMTCGSRPPLRSSVMHLSAEPGFSPSQPPNQSPVQPMMETTHFGSSPSRPEAY